MKGEFAGRAAEDAIVLEPLALAPGPLADEDAGEANLAAGANADLDDDVVEAGIARVLDLDVALEGTADGGGEVVSRELLCSFEDRLVVIRNVDGSVRHDCIVSPGDSGWRGLMRSTIRIRLRRSQAGRIRSHRLAQATDDQPRRADDRRVTRSAEVFADDPRAPAAADQCHADRVDRRPANDHAADHRALEPAVGPVARLQRGVRARGHVPHVPVDVLRGPRPGGPGDVLRAGFLSVAALVLGIRPRHRPDDVPADERGESR